MFKICSQLSKLHATDEEEKNIREFILSIKEDEDRQESFFQYCKKYKLAPWIFIQLNRKGLFSQLSKKTQEQFTSFYQKIKNQNEHRNEEAIRFLSAFKEQNIPVIIVKGNLFIHDVYEDTGYKKMNDFDLLINKEDWVKVQEIYFDLGYIPMGFGYRGEKQEPAKFSHVGIPFISKNLKCIAGTMWGLKSPSAAFTVPIEAAWETAENFDFHGLTLQKLSPEFNILHLILHMGIYKIGIRDTMDVFNYWDAVGVDEDLLYDLLVKANALDKAYFTLVISNLSSNSIPPEFIERIKPKKSSFLTRRLAARLATYKASGDIHYSYNDYFQDIEKEVIYMGLFHQFHQKLPYYLKVLKLTLFPKMEAALKLHDKAYRPTQKDKVVARIKAPYYVFSLLAQEIGWTFSILLFVKLFFDTFASLKNYFIKKETYFDYIKKLGVNPADIERTVAGIE